MTATLRHLRPLLIGIAVLMLTAGIALAGRPAGHAPGRAVASEASGKTVPVVADPGAGHGEEDTPAEQEPATDAAASENCATDPSDLTEQELADMRHGSVVCWAAHQETPDGYASHGAWVSEWARQNHGAAASSDAGDNADAGVRARSNVPDQAAGHVGQGKSHRP